jgi:hypothetical protein
MVVKTAPSNLITNETTPVRCGAKPRDAVIDLHLSAFPSGRAAADDIVTPGVDETMDRIVVR